MKISLSKDLLNKISDLSNKTIIRIIKITKSSTLISFKGHKLEVPFVLNKNKVYIAEIKNNLLLLEIKEDKKLKKDINKYIFKNLRKNLKKLDSFFFFDTKENLKLEQEIKNYLFHDLVNQNKKDDKIIFKNKYFRLRKEDSKEYIFIFNIPLYHKIARVFLKIGITDIFLNILSENINDIETNKIDNEIKEVLKDHNKNIIIKLTNKKDAFYEDIEIHLNKKNIDIKV